MDIQDLINDVTVFVPEAPDPLVVRVLRESAIAFCRNSTAWRHRLTFDTVADQAIYTPTLPVDASIAQVISGDTDNGPLYCTSDLVNHYENEIRGESGEPRYIERPKPTELRLTPAPNKSITGAVTAVLALMPTRTATTLPDAICEEYREPIIQGAVSKLFMLPNRPFSNPRDGQAFAHYAYAGAIDAKGRANQNHTSKRRTVRYGGL